MSTPKDVNTELGGADNDMPTILRGFIDDYGAKATVLSLAQALRDAADDDEGGNTIAGLLAGRLEDACR